MRIAYFEDAKGEGRRTEVRDQKSEIGDQKLERQLGQLGDVIPARKSRRLPVVLTRAEGEGGIESVRGAA